MWLQDHNFLKGWRINIIFYLVWLVWGLSYMQLYISLAKCTLTTIFTNFISLLPCINKIYFNYIYDNIYCQPNNQELGWQFHYCTFNKVQYYNKYTDRQKHTHLPFREYQWLIYLGFIPWKNVLPWNAAGGYWGYAAGKFVPGWGAFICASVIQGEANMYVL